MLAAEVFTLFGKLYDGERDLQRLDAGSWPLYCMRGGSPSVRRCAQMNDSNIGAAAIPAQPESLDGRRVPRATLTRRLRSGHEPESHRWTSRRREAA